MSLSSFARRTTVATALALAAAGLTLGQASSASAMEYVAASQAGTIEAPDGMVIGSDAYADGAMQPRIQAGALLVGASPASTAPQRVTARASLQRYDEAIGAWRSTDQTGTAQAWVDSGRRTMIGDGTTQASTWKFSPTEDAASLYRVSYMLTWYVHDGDTDPANDVVLGSAIVRPSDASEYDCNTTAFSNWPDVVYEVPCMVTAQGVVI